MTQAPRRQADQALGPDEIATRLAAELPNWTCRDGCIRRTFATGGWKASLMVANTVGHLAEAAWHHPDLTVTYASVEVRLSTHSAPGITEKDFALARKIDEVLMWRPAAEPGGALEGTPDDARFVYLKYE